MDRLNELKELLQKSIDCQLNGTCNSQQFQQICVMAIEQHIQIEKLNTVIEIFKSACDDATVKISMIDEKTREIHSIMEQQRKALKLLRFELTWIMLNNKELTIRYNNNKDNTQATLDYVNTLIPNK